LKFNELIKKGTIRKTSFDISLFKSLIKTAEMDLKYLDSVKITDASSRKTMTNYYDVMRSYLEALGLKHNYKIYTHEAYTLFLKELKQEVLAIKFDRQRKIRNNINYYGENITIDEAKENIKNIKELILKIKELIN
jgi:hypothetical protein